MDKKNSRLTPAIRALTVWTERPALFFRFVNRVHAPAFPPPNFLQFLFFSLAVTRQWCLEVFGRKKTELRLNSDLGGPGGGEMRIGLRNGPNLSKTDFW